jgi:Flp pilus assembly protein TadB
MKLALVLFVVCCAAPLIARAWQWHAQIRHEREAERRARVRARLERLHEPHLTREQRERIAKARGQQ